MEILKKILNIFTPQKDGTPQFVDLGLPSGLKWAKCNLGAETETDYGNYYMWGSTEPSTAEECNWANTPFNNGLSLYDEEHFTTHKSEWLDDKDNLKPEFDAAYKATDGAARMPTQDDIQELIDNTFHEWVENFNNSNVNGMKFISKTDKTKYIFIPAAGGCYGGSDGSVGDNGYVWSSSLNASGPHDAWGLYFYSDGCNVNGLYRYGGRSIRPVTD